VQRVLGGSKGYGKQKKSAAQVDTLMKLAMYFRVSFTSLFRATDRISIALQNDDESTPRELKRPRSR
jgi:hypothetical protein